MPQMEEMTFVDMEGCQGAFRLFQCPKCKKVQIVEDLGIPECDCDEDAFKRGKEHVKKKVSERIRELYDDEKPDLASLLVYIEHL